jgi:hypothetical protein
MPNVKISSFPQLTDPDDIRSAFFVGYVDSGGTSSARYNSPVFEQSIDLASTTGLLDLRNQAKTGSVLGVSNGGTSSTTANDVAQQFMPSTAADYGKQLRYNNSPSYPYLEWSDEYPVSFSLCRFSDDPNFNQYKTYVGGSIVEQQVKSGIGWPTNGTAGVQASFSFPFNSFCNLNSAGTWYIKATLVIKASSSNTYDLGVVRTSNTSLIVPLTAMAPTQNYPASGETIVVDFGANTSTLGFSRFGLYCSFRSGTSSNEIQILSAQLTFTRKP